jgi:hypothetical protein
MISFGMKAAWIKCSLEALFDSLEITPTLTANSLADLSRELAEWQ